MASHPQGGMQGGPIHQGTPRTGNANQPLYTYQGQGWGPGGSGAGYIPMNCNTSNGANALENMSGPQDGPADLVA